MACQEEGPCTIEDLPAEVLIAILKHVPLSQRLQSIDTVCQRLFSINRAPELWHCVNLGADPHWRGMVDYRLLNNLVYFSTGCRASLHNQVPHLCTIHTLDLRTAMCKLSAADLVKFCIRRLPSLKVLYACSVHQEHNYNPLYFHLEDMLYAAELMDHHHSALVVHMDATLHVHQAMQHLLHHEGDHVQRLLDELQRPSKPRLVLHRLSLTYTHQPRFTFANVYGRLLQQLLLHPNSCIRHLDIFSDSVPILIYDVCMQCSTLSRLTLNAELNESVIDALTTALTNGRWRQLTHLLLFGRDLLDTQVNHLFQAASKWLLQSNLLVLDIDYEWLHANPRTHSSHTRKIVSAVAARKAQNRPCQQVVLRHFTRDAQIVITHEASELGVHDMIQFK